MFPKSPNQSHILTPNAILEISAGFEGIYTLQIISCRISSEQELHLCLTDGNIYVGAIFKGNLEEQVQKYNLVEVRCKFVSRWRPIIITELKIISKWFSGLIGKPPTTLQQFFTSNCAEEEKDRGQKNHHLHDMDISIPHKRHKKIYDEASESQSCIPSHDLDPPTQKLPYSGELGQSADLLQTQKICSQNPPQQNNPQIYQIKKNSKISTFDHVSENQHLSEISSSKTQSLKVPVETHTFYVSDLYERMPGWKILCRVNYLRDFVSAKGTRCKMMYLIDQKGDNIKAMFYANNEEDREIIVGKSYSFSKGQITEINSEDKKYCELRLDPTCKMTLHEDIFINPYNHKKLKSFHELAYLNKEEVSIIGILKEFEKIQVSQAKRKIKIKGIIAHPLESMEIEFSKFMLEGEEELEEGKLYVVYRFVVMASDNTVKLMSGTRSYLAKISQVNHEKGETISTDGNRLLEIIQKEEWKDKKYNNLSQVKYVIRTIKQMKSMIKQSDSSIFSIISCHVNDVHIKRQYRACPHCKRMTSEEVKNLWKCFKCLKIVDTVPTFVLSLVLADSTGSFEVEVLGKNAMVFLGIDAEQLFEMSEGQQNLHILLSKFSQFMIKLKTEKNSESETNYSISYSINEVEEGKHEVSMKEIRRRTVQNKLKYEESWGSEKKEDIIKIQEQ